MLKVSPLGHLQRLLPLLMTRSLNVLPLPVMTSLASNAFDSLFLVFAS